MKLQFEERSKYKKIKEDFDNLVAGVIEGTSWKPEQVVEVY